jgi:hypothetical protein
MGIEWGLDGMGLGIGRNGIIMACIYDTHLIYIKQEHTHTHTHTCTTTTTRKEQKRK